MKEDLRTKKICLQEFAVLSSVGSRLGDITRVFFLRAPCASRIILECDSHGHDSQCILLLVENTTFLSVCNICDLSVVCLSDQTSRDQTSDHNF